MVSFAVAVSYTYRNFNGDKNYILRRKTHLTVSYCWMRLDVHSVVGKSATGLDVRRFEAFLSFSRQMLTNHPRPPSTESLSSRSSCSVYLRAVSHIATVPKISLPDLITRWHTRHANEFTFSALSLAFILRST
jgi:hypothetical protein